MENFDHEHVKFHSKIAAIEHSKYLTEEQKVHQISILRSIQAQSTDSSPKTIWGITNCMIGSAMIVYPVLFVKSGIVLSSIIMLIVACIQYVTCRLLVVHNRPDEDTYNESILRIGGIKINKINSVVNMLLFFFSCVAYFVLVTHNFYEVSSVLLNSVLGSYVPPPSQDFVIGRYSTQWSAVIAFFAIKSIVFKREIDSLLKIAKFSIYAVLAYAIFILFNLIRHLSNGNVHMNQFLYFTPDFSSVAGAFALSFLVHPMAATILKKNVDLNNNSRDLFLGYALGAGLLFFVGFFGALSCAPEVPFIISSPSNYSTIFDCVSRTGARGDSFFYFLSKLVQLGILFQNFTILPIMLFLTRNEFISLVGQPKLREMLFEKFTWVYLIFSAIIALCAIDVSVILSLNGAVIGFFMGYGIPIYIHVRCLFHKYTPDEDKKRKSLMESLINESILGENQHELELEPEALECNDHEPANKLTTLLIYGTMILCGLTLGFFKISALFN